MNPHILKKPIITEKSIHLASTQNVYTFEVDKLANKQQIKQAVEELYEVKVTGVNTTTKNATLKKTGKRRLFKRIERVKRAMVVLKKGQTIDLFDTYKE
ncbi:50S ribosomal protein L23 [Patescibacteria group bacterium]|nr:50S ribosomal protein L23 [Patescibacteria group bacterium]MBU1966936.1 50S ribosomal protein L23 [Patescibacteria group bacterium]MBU2543716.1 50S ribosomal protein L23 [Patescibacteria group bacterium]